jgi:hypothetical protein
MRTIVLRHSPNFVPSYGHQIQQFQNALGYLVGWALATGNYTYVEISVHSNGDIAGSYWSNAEAVNAPIPKPGYMLFGQHSCFFFGSSFFRSEPMKP